MIDLATREKAAALAEALDRLSLELENTKESADDATYAALENAERDAQKTYSEFQHPVAMKNDGSALCCPMCKAPILEEDLESCEVEIA